MYELKQYDSHIHINSMDVFHRFTRIYSVYNIFTGLNQLLLQKICINVVEIRHDFMNIYFNLTYLQTTEF